MFLPLPLAIWLSLVLAGLAVSDSGLSLLLTCVSELLGDQFSPRGIWVWRAMPQDQLWVQMETRRILSLALPWFMCPDDSGRVPPRPGILTESGCLTCAQRCISTPGRPVLFWKNLGMECCGTGSALCVDGNQKDPLLGFSSVPLF